MTRHSPRALVLRSAVYACALGCALLACTPQRACAQFAYAVLTGEGAMHLPIKAPYAANGAGFAARLGTRIGLPSAQQTFELGFDYATFGAGDATTKSERFTAFRGVVGMRLGLDGILKPGLFAHLGAGRVLGQIVAANRIESLTHTGFAWDGGVYVDLALAKAFEFGIQCSYNQIVKTGNTRAFQWLALGAHLQLVL